MYYSSKSKYRLRSKKIFASSLILIIFTALFTASCNSDSCPNRDALFLSSDEYKPVPADSLSTFRSFTNYLEQTYCVENEELLPVIFFDMKKKEITAGAGVNVIPVSIEPPLCEGDYEFEFDKILEIVLDGNNILIENKRMPLDSIPQYVYYQYLSFGIIPGFSRYPQGNGIWLISELKRPMSDFNPLLDKVITGYIVTASHLANALFEKKICELNEKEMRHLKSLIQFHLSFKYSDEPTPLLQSE